MEQGIVQVEQPLLRARVVADLVSPLNREGRRVGQRFEIGRNIMRVHNLCARLRGPDMSEMCFACAHGSAKHQLARRPIAPAVNLRHGARVGG